MRISRWLGAAVLSVLCTTSVRSQQLRLGSQPYSVEKSAVLELQSNNQGLLFSRIADTALINALNPPDGMVIYYTPAAKLLLRANGHWQSLTPASSLNSYWSMDGNGYGAEKKLGTTDNHALPFITNNTERMRITNAGKIGIGNAAPTEALDLTGNLKFSGALMPAGNAGTAGYVLTSNGAGAAPTWTSVSGSSGGWSLDGNNVTSVRAFGTTSAYDLPFITNNTERMRLSGTGNVAIGTGSFDPDAAEKLLIDAGTTSSYNLLVAKGSRDGYLQFNIQNRSASGNASTDIVATANNGTETTNYVNLGINGGGYNNANNILSGANNGYLYSAGQHFLIGNTSPSKDLIFFSGGISPSHERMRLSSTGNVAIGSSTFDATAPEKLLIDGTDNSTYNLIVAKGDVNNYLQFNIQNQSSGSLASTDIVATNNSGTETARYINMGINSSGYTNTGILGGANNAYLYATGSDLIIGNATAGEPLRLFTGGTNTTNERMRIDGSGNIGIGTTSPAYPLHVVKSSGTVAAFNRTSSDGTIISLQQDGVEEGSVSVSGNTVSFNAFTGSHYAWTAQPVEKGMLVTLTGENRYLHDNKRSEIIYGVQPSAKTNDPKIMGAYLGLKESSQPYSNDNPNLIMAVGNGLMWVADKGEDLAVGDYLISSDIAGHAMKENGMFPTAFIIARVAEPVQWAVETAVVAGVKHKLVSVFFESFVKNNAQKELEALRQEMKDMKERILQLEKLATQR